MIGNNAHDVGPQLARMMAVQKVEQAVVVLRHHNKHVGGVVDPSKPQRSVKLLDVYFQRVTYLVGAFNLDVEHRTHTKRASDHVGELGILNDVCAELVQASRHGCNDAWSVGTSQCQDVGSHGETVSPGAYGRVWLQPSVRPQASGDMKYAHPL